MGRMAELGEVKDGDDHGWEDQRLMLNKRTMKFAWKSAKWMLAVGLLCREEGVHMKMSVKWQGWCGGNECKMQSELRNMEDSTIDRRSAGFQSWSFVGTSKSEQSPVQG